MNTPGHHKTATPSPASAPRAAARERREEHQAGDAVAVALSAAILAVRAGEPVVAVVPAQRAGEESLPSGPFRPSQHRTLESGVGSWVRTQTGVELGFLQQLCTLADCAEPDEPAQPTISVSYLALVGPRQCSDRTPASWRSWYTFFPWEDWRHGRPECLDGVMRRLDAWAAQGAQPCVAAAQPDERRQRIETMFGRAGGWDEEKVLERYALLREAGVADGGASNGAAWRASRLVHPVLGDQASVLARAIGELRRGVKRRPVLLELMPDAFTLFELQRTVEAILGPHLHKQNFRRLVEGGGLVEPTGEQRLRTGGRPARLYRFRRDAHYALSASGVRVKAGQA